MRTKNLLIIGILLFGGIVPHSLQSVSLPQEAQAASEKDLKNASISYTWEKIRAQQNSRIAAYRARIQKRYQNRATININQQRSIQKKDQKTLAVISRSYEQAKSRVKKAQNKKVAVDVIPTPAPKAPTFLPAINQDDIQLKHKEIANEVLTSLPHKCQDTLKNFHVQYDNPKRRGLAGKNTIILSGVVPDQEFRALLIHELGHVFDLNQSTACLAGTKNAGYSEFKDGNDPVYNNDPSLEFYRISWSGPKTKRAGTTKGDFVSGYAAWDVFEDFAESFAYFVLHNETFLERSKYNVSLAQKYNFFKRYLFPNGVELATTQHNWTGKIPWDVTKLPYTWIEDQSQIAYQ